MGYRVDNYRREGLMYTSLNSHYVNRQWLHSTMTRMRLGQCMVITKISKQFVIYGETLADTNTVNSCCISRDHLKSRVHCLAHDIPRIGPQTNQQSC